MFCRGWSLACNVSLSRHRCHVGITYGFCYLLGGGGGGGVFVFMFFLLLFSSFKAVLFACAERVVMASFCYIMTFS